MCEKRFFRKSTLKVHKRTHAKEERAKGDEISKSACNGTLSTPVPDEKVAAKCRGGLRFSPREVRSTPRTGALCTPAAQRSCGVFHNQRDMSYSINNYIPIFPSVDLKLLGPQENRGVQLEFNAVSYGLSFVPLTDQIVPFGFGNDGLIYCVKDPDSN